jgi:DDE superfamily endonuclease
VIIFGFLPQNLKMMAVAVAFSMAWRGAVVEDGRVAGPGRARGRLAGFRSELYRCLTARPDALFGLADAVLCGAGRVTDLARLSLVPEFGRGHGALYDGLNAGEIDAGRLRAALAGLPLPAWPDGRIRLGIDVSSWLRPEAQTSPERMFCHVHGRGRNAGQVTPGWPYSVVMALGPGASSWTLPLDAVRLGPDDDDLEVTAGQLRAVAGRLREAGCWQPGDPAILVAMDAGYNVTRLAFLLADLPLVLVARVRSDRVFYRDPAPRDRPAAGQPPRHGEPVRCGDPATQGSPGIRQDASTRHGPVAVAAWNRVHQALHRGCGGWEDWPHKTHFPVVAGTLIRLASAGPRFAEPMWLWASAAAAGPGEVGELWQCYLRRFDLEHTFRFLKQQLGWTRPLLRDPQSADRWTWLLLACYAQLYLARPLAADIRLPWQRHRARAGEPLVMTPGRVRAGFRHARAAVGTPASVAKPGRPGPGRPAGSKNKHKAPRQPVGKTRPKKRRPARNPRKKAKQAG